jgi:hypothetical protein
MTIQQVISSEKEINELVLQGKMMEAFMKFYGDDVIMIENDGSSNSGKAACQAYEEGFMSSIVEFKEAKLLSSIVLPSPDSNYEFLVIATWYNDIMTTNYPIKGNQTSFTYWKEGMVRKNEFKSGSEVIA